MKKYKKLFIFASVLLVIAIVIFLWLPPSQERIEKCFFRDKAELTMVCDYLLSLDCEARIEYDGIDCYLEKYEPVLSSDKLNVVKVKIENEPLSDAIKYLLSKREYYKIFKSDNIITFVKWRRGRDWSGGVAYKIDKSGELEVPYVTKSSPLSNDGWYYYESNYNQWRENNE